MTALAYRATYIPAKGTHSYIARRSSSSRVAEAHYEAGEADYVSDFNDLVYRWKVEIAFLSTTHEMMQTPSFAQIVGMGKTVVPLIIEEIKTQPNFLFLALHVITKENPVPAEAQGNINDIVSAWLAWAERNPQYAD